MKEYLNREVVRRIIDSERSKEQMLNMLGMIPSADVVEVDALLKQAYEHMDDNALIGLRNALDELKEH